MLLVGDRLRLLTAGRRRQTTVVREALITFMTVRNSDYLNKDGIVIAGD